MKQWKIVVPLVVLMAIQYFYFEQQLELARQPTVRFPQPSQGKVLNQLQLPEFSQLAEKAKPSVVSIEVFNEGASRQYNGVGSGFIISEDGYLLTNYHVTQGDGELVVKLADGREFDAERIGNDPETDLALIKIATSGLDAFEFGSVEKTQVGSWVVAIGAPFGFEQTVTAGIISAKGRSVGEQYIPYLQTDVAINVGNSGGPLINMDGKVIGVNSKIISTDGGSLGLSFAIPIDLAVDVVNQLKNVGRVSRGFLGVGYEEVTRSVAEDSALDRQHGALINTVSRNSPAEVAGLKVGDIVTAVDGKKIVRYTELPFLVGRLRPGMETILSVFRDGKLKAVSIVIGSRDPRDVTANSLPPLFDLEAEDDRNLLNIAVSALSLDTKQYLELSTGVLVDSVDIGPASKAGLKKGDVILAIQSVPIVGVEGYNEILRDLREDSSIELLVLRHMQKGATETIRVELVD